MSITRIEEKVIDGTTVSMVLIDGEYEVAAFANGDECRAPYRTTCEIKARLAFNRIVDEVSGVDTLARYWAGSASASVENAYRTGNFVTVYV